MTVKYPTRLVAASALALLLTLSLSAGTLAQDETASPPIIVVTQVDSEAFPQVTAYVAVSGEDGLPLEGLTVRSFTLQEDGVKVPSASVVVEEDNTQSFSLVLAIDVSTDPENLDRIREAALRFLDGLGPRDQTAVVAFYDEVKVIQDFSSDKRTLNAAMNALGAQGDYTALNQAIQETADLAGELPSGRRLVLLLTDSRDNVKNVSAADAIDRAVELGVPVYTIGFGAKIRPDDLQEVSDLTKGQAYILTNLDELQDKLQEVQKLLRQGYKVTFQSGILADNAEHDLSVGVSYEAQEGETESRFVAVPGEVTVTLDNILDGQQVGQGDVVSLSPQVTAAGPIASVEYFLDDELLAKQETPPYSFDWDSADVEQGVHVLSVKAVDSVGNEGQVEVNLDIVLPLIVTVTTTRDEVKLGDEVTVQAQVDVFGDRDVVGVEFMLDGQSLGRDEAPSYNYSLDSGAYPMGAHVITVRAEDSVGREEQASVDVQFVAPPEPTPVPEEPTTSFEWLPFLASFVALVILVVALVTLIRLIARRKMRYKKAYQLEVSNLGNMPSRYELRAEDPADLLEFEFTLNGKNLQQRPIAEVEGVVEVVQADQPPSAVPAEVPSQRRAPDVQQATGQAMRAGSILGRLLNTLSTILPGSAGRSARQMRGQLFRGERQVRRADRLSRQVSRVRPTAAPSGPTVESVPQERAAPTFHVSQISQPSIIHTWAQTPMLEPGEILTVDLLINPLKLFQSQYHPFVLLSRSVEQADALLMTEQVGIEVRRPSWLRRLYPYLAVLTIMAATVSLYIAFLVDRGILD